MLSGASSILHCLGRGWDTTDLWLSTARTNPFLVAVWVAILRTNSIAGYPKNPKTRPFCLISIVSASAFTCSNLEDTDFQPIFQLKTTVNHWVIAWGRRSSKSSGFFPHRPTSTYLFSGTPTLRSTHIQQKERQGVKFPDHPEKKSKKTMNPRIGRKIYRKNPVRLSDKPNQPVPSRYPRRVGALFRQCHQVMGPVFGTTLPAVLMRSVYKWLGIKQVPSFLTATHCNGGSVWTILEDSFRVLKFH